MAAIKTELEKNHPGAVDPENPQFAKWMREGYLEASELAKRADSPEGYYYALRRYADGFNDTHLSVFRSDNFQLENSFWPGYAVSLHNDRFIVSDLNDLELNYVVKEKLPQPGDVLIACNGKSASEVFASNVSPFYGVEGLATYKRFFAPFLMLDFSNPYIERPTRCTFENRLGQRYDRDLNWQPLRSDRLISLLNFARSAIEHPEMGLREIKPGIFWITLSSFGTSEERIKQLRSVIKAASQQKDELQASKVIVFDVRGNGGGISIWGKDLLESIWGKGFIERLPGSGSIAVDWRASKENIAAIERNRSERAKQWEQDSYMMRFFDDLISGMKKAFNSGNNYYHKPTGFVSNEKAIRSGEVKPKIYLLSDGSCASACLDFADWVLSIPEAELIGRETNADTQYMENRTVKLPSNKIYFSLSMKVYRGRVRGSNEPYRPTHQWNGKDWGDIKALQDWVLELSAN